MRDFVQQHLLEPLRFRCHRRTRVDANDAKERDVVTEQVRSVVVVDRRVVLSVEEDPGVVEVVRVHVEDLAKAREDLPSPPGGSLDEGVVPVGVEDEVLVRVRRAVDEAATARREHRDDEQNQERESSSWKEHSRFHQ